MYAPTVGRFLSEDPAGFVDGPNRYLYVRNSPVNYVDPSGKVPIRCECFFSGGGYMGSQQWVPVDCKGLANTCCDKACNAVNGSYEGYWDNDPRYTGGIKLCQRNIDPSAPCGRIADYCGGEHVYLQFGAVELDGTPAPGTIGLGLRGGSAGELPSKEDAFHPTFCRDIQRTNGVLASGSGVGKTGKNATDAEIQACVQTRLTRNPYHGWNYNCVAWAREAMNACGIYAAIGADL